MWLVGWLAFNSILYFEFTLGDKNIDFVILGNNFDIFSYCMNCIVTREATDRTREKIIHLKELIFMDSNLQQVL